MYYIFTRTEFVLSFFFAAIVTVLLVFVPPYQKIVYEKTPAITPKEAEEKVRITGYKAGEGIPLAYSETDMSNEDDTEYINFTIKIKNNNLEPTGIYREVNGSKFETNKLKIMLLKNWKIYGQFYIVTLDSGERLPILIQEKYLKRIDGLIQLPICRINNSFSLADYWGSKTDTYQKYNLNCLDPTGSHYIDACSAFSQGSEMESFRTKQTFAAIIVFIICLFGGYFLLLLVSNGLKKK